MKRQDFVTSAKGKNQIFEILSVHGQNAIIKPISGGLSRPAKVSTLTKIA